MMKRKLCFGLALMLCLMLLTGCGPQEAADPDRLQVVTTLFPYYDFARIVGGEHVSVTMLLSPGQETHSYEPTPQDVTRILGADVFAYTGGESEAYMTDLLADLDAEHTTVLRLIEQVDTLCSDGDHDHDADEGHDHGQVDEHIWTDPSNAKVLVQTLCDTFCALDAEHATDYQANAAAYLAELDHLDADFRTVVAEAARDTVIFGDRFPLLYFAEAYGLHYEAAFSGCASDIEPSAATVADLIEQVKAEQIPVVFYIELSNHNIAQTIAEETGAKAMLFYSCQTITRDDFEAGESYLSLMRRNVATLKEALN